MTNVEFQWASGTTLENIYGQRKTVFQLPGNSRESIEHDNSGHLRAAKHKRLYYVRGRDFASEEELETWIAGGDQLEVDCAKAIGEMLRRDGDGRMARRDLFVALLLRGFHAKTIEHSLFWLTHYDFVKQTLDQIQYQGDDKWYHRQN